MQEAVAGYLAAEPREIDSGAPEGLVDDIDEVETPPTVEALGGSLPLFTKIPDKLTRDLTVLGAPVPTSDPTYGAGLILALGALYQLDPASPSSITAVVGMATTNGSWALGLLQNTYFANDNVRVNGTVAAGDLIYPFYGVGNDAGDRGIDIELSQLGWLTQIDVQYRIEGAAFVGVRYEFMDATFSPTRLDPSVPVPPDSQLDARTASLGLVFSLDTRDNPLNATRGGYVGLTTRFASKAFGGNFDYQTYDIEGNLYEKVGRGQVLAIRGRVCYASNSTPFFHLCQFGSDSDLRGYISGRWRDQAMASFQAEYRATVWRWLGVVVFGGIGQVAPSFLQFRSDNLLPGAGFGFRIRLSKAEGLNFRLDFAWGRDSFGVHVLVAEAF